MRQHLIAALLVPAFAFADKTDKHKPIDISAMKTKVIAFKDVTGKIYVVPNPSITEGEDVRKWTFYGDGKTMYQQRVQASSAQGATRSIGTPQSRIRSMMARAPKAVASINAR